MHMFALALCKYLRSMKRRKHLKVIYCASARLVASEHAVVLYPVKVMCMVKL